MEENDRRLIWALVDAAESDMGYPALGLLHGARYFHNVRALTLGDFEGTRGFWTYPDGVPLVGILDVFPNLRELNLNASDIQEQELFASAIFRQLHTLRMERVRLYEDKKPYRDPALAPPPGRAAAPVKD